MCEIGNWIMHDYYMARISEIEKRFGKGITKLDKMKEVKIILKKLEK